MYYIYLYHWHICTDNWDEKYHAEVDRLGLDSGIAQELNGPITSINKLQNSNHSIIIYYTTTTTTATTNNNTTATTTKSDKSNKDNIVCKGYIKYGKKSLYLYQKDGKLIQSDPFCLLDFYVDEKIQRSGIGLLLFSKMLEVRKKVQDNLCIIFFLWGIMYLIWDW